MLHRQKGFSVLEVVIILAIVGLLGLGGWCLWQFKYKDQAAKNTRTTTTQRAVGKKPQYLTITEWGVRLPVTDEAPYYQFDEESATNTANVYSNKYNNLTNANGVVCASADDNDGTNPAKKLRQLTFIRRDTLAEVAANKDKPEYYQYVKEKVTIGDYEYATGYASLYQPGCAYAGGSKSKPDNTIVTTERQISDSLIAEFKKLAAVR